MNGNKRNKWEEDLTDSSYDSVFDKLLGKNKSQMSDIAEQVNNMSYDNFTQGDTYKNLEKRYQDNGQKAMDDTIGKVAARTGGIASSYATTAGNQAYQEWMANLEDAARSLYDSERQEMLDRYQIAKDMYNMDYQEQRDNKADYKWKREQNFAEEQYDYKKGQEELANEKTYADTEIAERLVSGESLDNMGDLISKSSYPDPAYWNAWLANQALVEETPEETPVETVAPIYKYAYNGDNGMVYHDENGKEVTVAVGYNPYTRTRNPDIGENGENAMDNGYQPDNIKGEKLRIWQGDLAEADDGSELTVYVLGGHESMSKAQYYVWDEAENKYQLLTAADLKKIGIDTSSFK